MYKVGTVCMKLAGRDAGNLCVVVEEPAQGKALVDGGVRRKAVNLRHLEPTGREVKIKAGASHEEVAKALGMEPRKQSTKQKAEKPVRKKAAKKAVKKPSKKAAKSQKSE